MAYKDANTLYLLKFNHPEDMLYDECVDNKWSIGKYYTEDKTEPRVSYSQSLLDNPSLCVSGMNYIKINNTKFDLNLPTWTIDFWMFIPKSVQSSTYLSIRGDVLVVRNNKVSIKTEDGNTYDITNKIYTNKWFHFALVKHSSFISVYIDGMRISYKKFYSPLKHDSGNYPNIISLGKSVTSIGVKNPYNIIQFRISDIARFKIDEKFDPITTLAFITRIGRKIERSLQHHYTPTLISYESNNVFKFDTYVNTLITDKLILNIKRLLKHRYYKKFNYDLKRLVLHIQENMTDTFLGCNAINLNDTCLNIIRPITFELQTIRSLRIPGSLLYHYEYFYHPYDSTLSNRIVSLTTFIDAERKVYRLKKVKSEFIPDDDRYDEFGHTPEYYSTPYPIIFIPTDYDSLYEDITEEEYSGAAYGKPDYTISIGPRRIIQTIDVHLYNDTCKRVYQFVEEIDKGYSDPFKFNPTLYDDLFIKRNKNQQRVTHIFVGFKLETDLIRKVYRVKTIQEEPTEIIDNTPFETTITEYDDKYEYNPMVFNSEPNIHKPLFSILICSLIDLMRHVYYEKEIIEEIDIIDKPTPFQINKTEYDDDFYFNPLSAMPNYKIDQVVVQIDTDLLRRIHREKITKEDQSDYVPHEIKISKYDTNYRLGNIQDDPILRYNYTSKFSFLLNEKTDTMRRVYFERIALEEVRNRETVELKYNSKNQHSSMHEDQYIATRFLPNSLLTLRLETDLYRNVYSQNSESIIVEESAIEENYIPHEIRETDYDKKYIPRTDKEEAMIPTRLIYFSSDLIRKVYQEIIIDINEEEEEHYYIREKSWYDNNYEYDPYDKYQVRKIYLQTNLDLIRCIYQEKITEEDQFDYIPHQITQTEYDNKYEFNPIPAISEYTIDYITLQLENDLVRSVYQEVVEDLTSPKLPYKIRLYTPYHRRYHLSSESKPINKSSSSFNKDFILTLQLETDLVRKVYQEEIISAIEPKLPYKIRLYTAYHRRYHYNPERNKIYPIPIRLISDSIRKVYKEIKIIPDDNSNVNDNVPFTITPTEYDNRYYLEDPDYSRIFPVEWFLTLQLENDLKRTIYNQDIEPLTQQLPYKIRLYTNYHKRYYYNPMQLQNGTIFIKVKIDLSREIFKIVPETEYKPVTPSVYDEDYEYNPVKPFYSTITITNSMDLNRQIIYYDKPLKDIKSFIYLVEEFETKRINKIEDIDIMSSLKKSEYDKKYIYDNSSNDDIINTIRVKYINDMRRDIIHKPKNIIPTSEVINRLRITPYDHNYVYDKDYAKHIVLLKIAEIFDTRRDINKISQPYDESLAIQRIEKIKEYDRKSYAARAAMKSTIKKIQVGTVVSVIRYIVQYVSDDWELKPGCLVEISEEFDTKRINKLYNTYTISYHEQYQYDPV